MRMLLRKLQSEWPSVLAVAFIALLPFARLSEIPLSLFALSLPFLARSIDYRRQIRSAAALVVPLYLCYWLPMVFSSVDAVDPGKSWVQTLVSLRFPAAALSMAVLLRPPSARWRVLRWTALVLLFWAVDGFVQLLFGNDLFGIAMHPDRLNALFIKKYQFFGPTLAMLSPIALEYARRQWPPWAWALTFTLLLGAVLISGMRAGWLTMAIVLVTYAALMVQRENRELRRTMLSVPVLLVVVVGMSYLVSPMFQQRLEITRDIFKGTELAVDRASSERLPIFRAAWNMYRAEPINGVGVRGFSTAYIDFAEANDPHIRKSGGARGATHAHNVVLEVMSDTGTIGLIGLLTGFVLAWRRWRVATPAGRQESFPYVLSLALILFPLNSHFAIYGTYTSSLIWFLVGLWAASHRDWDEIRPKRSAPPRK